MWDQAWLEEGFRYVHEYSFCPCLRVRCHTGFRLLKGALSSEIARPKSGRFACLLQPICHETICFSGALHMCDMFATLIGGFWKMSRHIPWCTKNRLCWFLCKAMASPESHAESFQLKHKHTRQPCMQKTRRICTCMSMCAFMPVCLQPLSLYLPVYIYI